MMELTCYYGVRDCMTNAIFDDLGKMRVAQWVSFALSLDVICVGKALSVCGNCFLDQMILSPATFPVVAAFAHCQRNAWRGPQFTFASIKMAIWK